MAAAAFPTPDSALCLRTPLDDRHGWGFALLLAVVATLFLRPADLIPALHDWPIYQFLIVGCLIVSARATMRQLRFRQLVEQPVAACLSVVLLSVIVSHLSHGFVWGARMSMYEVSKLLAIYLLITGLVNTPRRLVVFVRWLTLAITTVAVLALLDRAGWISIAALEPVNSRGPNVEGQTIFIERIRGTGIFQDPNDFGLILVTGFILSASFLFRPRAGWPRYLWLIPGCVLLTTLALTHSRGALLSLSCAFPAALAYWRGWKLGLFALLVLPLLAFFFSARMTDVNAVVVGTGQSRIQIWSDSLTIWWHYPVFGMGEGLLADELGVVAHNSFLHCYAELGLFGGTAFLSCFLVAGLGLWSLRDADVGDLGTEQAAAKRREFAHQGGFIFAVLVAYAAGIMTVSRQFVSPTYLILGVATSAQSLLSPNAMRRPVGNRLLVLILLSSAAYLVGIYLVIRILVRW